jgi:hypothetical protein
MSQVQSLAVTLIHLLHKSSIKNSCYPWLDFSGGLHSENNHRSRAM